MTQLSLAGRLFNFCGLGKSNFRNHSATRMNVIRVEVAQGEKTIIVPLLWSLTLLGTRTDVLNTTFALCEDPYELLCIILYKLRKLM